MAAFSYESIDFGDLESNQVSNRFVILYNLHQTQTLKFDFQKSGLMCGDNLKLEPMCGELEPNSHQNIKMTLRKDNSLEAAKWRAHSCIPQKSKFYH